MVGRRGELRTGNIFRGFRSGGNYFPWKNKRFSGRVPLAVSSHHRRHGHPASAVREDKGTVLALYQALPPGRGDDALGETMVPFQMFVEVRNAVLADLLRKS